MNISRILKEYNSMKNEYDENEKHLDKRIEHRKAQLERLENRRRKLHFPSWVDNMVKPIAEELIKHFQDRCYDILGPFGIGARTSIHFYKKGTDETNQFDECLSITFEPNLFNEGKATLGVVDYNTDTQRYSKGTIGAINGFNHPLMPLPENITVQWLMDFMMKT